jgi:hypothetical protein
MNKVVARFADGRMVKGATSDFSPEKDRFHVTESRPGAKPVEIFTKELKAVFFVRDFAGNPKHEERRQFDPGKPSPPGRKLRVVFKDGEVVVGTTSAYQPGRQGFFITPADGSSNNTRCYVVAAATEHVEFV